MQPQRFFKLATKTGPALFILETTLKPKSHFSPEDKESIAALHAKHIESYLSSGLNLAAQIILIEESTYRGIPGTMMSKQSTFTTVSGNTIDVQTIFSPFENQIPDNILKDCRHLTLKGQSYD
jgi:hypothetical protein